MHSCGSFKSTTLAAGAPCGPMPWRRAVETAFDGRRGCAVWRGMALDLVVFDLDGTLVDSLPDIADALNHGLAAHGLAPLSIEVVGTLVGDGIVALARRALEAQPDAPSLGAEELAHTVWEHYLQNPCVKTRPYPQIPGVLTTLQERGIPLAVVTNKPGNVARPLLGALNLLETFTDVVGDGDGFARKPDPAVLLHLMARHKARPEATLMVGDGIPDVQVAKAAGCVAVAALWGYTARAKLLEQRPNNALLEPEQVLELP